MFPKAGRCSSLVTLERREKAWEIQYLGLESTERVDCLGGVGKKEKDTYQNEILGGYLWHHKV